MKFLGYILVYSMIWLLHLLPERILYLISDLLAGFVYHVVRYRKKVVFENIAMAFPDFDRKQLRQTARKFYRHLSDTILEMAVSQFYSVDDVRKKVRYINPEVLNEFYDKGKQVMAVAAHYGNWEYFSTTALFIKHPVVVIYKPLKNKYFDRMVKSNRTRFGVMVTPMETIARKLMTFQREHKPVIAVFLSDQRPIFQHIQYWTKFMGIDTPLHLGTEKLARKLDAAVVFLKVSRVSRGRYEVEIETICEDPGTMPPYAITEAHVRILEKMIREEPAYWLWSHRRWRYSLEQFRKEYPDRNIPD